MQKNKINKKEKIKGALLIGIGIFGLVVYIIVEFRDIHLGGGFFVILISIILILEGLRIIKGEKPRIFNI